MGTTEPDRERSMSDATDTTSTDTTDTSTADTSTDAATTDTGDATDWKAEAEKWKTFSRKHEEQAKANAKAAAKLAEIEDANATEVEKATKAAQKFAADAASAQAELAIVKAAVKHGLTEDDLELLGSHGTAMEIDARAEKLAARLKAAAPEPKKPDFGAGDRGDDVKSGADQLTKDDMQRMYAEKKYAEIEEHRAAGRLNDVLGIKPKS